MGERLRDMRMMLGVGWRIDRRLTASLIAMTVLTNLAGVARALWFKFLLDGIVAADMTAAVMWAVVLSVSDAFRSWALVGSQMDRQDLHDRALHYFQQESMRLAGSVSSVEHHERADHIDRLTVFRDSFPTLASALGNLVDGIAQVVRAAFTFILLATLHPALLVLPAFAVPSLGAARLAERINQHAFLAAAAPARRNDHLWTLLTTPGPGKEIRVFNLGNELRRREAAAWRDVTRIQTTAKAKAGAVTAAGWTIFALGYIAAILLLIQQAAAGHATAGDVLLGVVLAGQVNWQVSGAVALVGTLSQAFHAMGHYRWLTDYAMAGTTDGETTPAPTRLRNGITFNAVSFRYPGTDAAVLQDIDLQLPAGAVVALVGENGAGKTTLVKLLGRLYTPTTGAITVDGTDLQAIDLAEWRTRIAAGFQDFMRYEFMAREAVGVGNLAAIDQPDAVLAALDRAGAPEFVTALPDKLETQLGKQFRSGVDLSGGQWQKVALGRAMMRPDPLLLILDEPTAALDAHSEHDLFQRYAHGARSAAARNGAITVLVSHRFSTVRMADRIVVLDGGQIREAGTHQDLIARRDLYAELYELQARSYR